MNKINLDFTNNSFSIDIYDSDNKTLNSNKIFINYNSQFFNNLKTDLGISDNNKIIELGIESTSENLANIGIAYTAKYNEIDLYIANNNYENVPFLLCAYKNTKNEIIYDPKNRHWSYLIMNEVGVKEDEVIDIDVRTFLKWTKIPKDVYKNIRNIEKKLNTILPNCWLKHFSIRFHIQMFNNLIENKIIFYKEQGIFYKEPKTWLEENKNYDYFLSTSYDSKNYIIMHTALYYNNKSVYAFFLENENSGKEPPYTFVALNTWDNSLCIILDNSVSKPNSILKNNKKSDLPKMYTPSSLANLNEKSEIEIADHAIERFLDRCPNHNIILDFNKKNTEGIRTLFNEYQDCKKKIKRPNLSEDERNQIINITKKYNSFKDDLKEHIKNSIKNKNNRHPMVYINNIKNSNDIYTMVVSELINCRTFECVIIIDDSNAHIEDIEYISPTILSKEMATKKKNHFPIN